MTSRHASTASGFASSNLSFGSAATNITSRTTIREKVTKFDPGSDFWARIAILGDKGVGKSTLLEREIAAGPVPIKNSKSNNINFLSKRYKIMESLCTLQYWDAPGDHECAVETGRYCAGSAGYVLVFDVNDPQTFKSLESIWIPEIRRSLNRTKAKSIRDRTSLRSDAKLSRPHSVRGRSQATEESEEEDEDDGLTDIMNSEVEDWPPMIIIGNKADDDGLSVSEDEVAGLGKTNRVYMDEATMFAERYNAEYFETSAKYGPGVSDAFSHITMETGKRIPDPMDYSILLNKRVRPVRPLSHVEGVLYRQALHKMRIALLEDGADDVDWL